MLTGELTVDGACARTHAGVSILNAIATGRYGGALAVPGLQLKACAIIESRSKKTRLIIKSNIDPGKKTIETLQEKAAQLGLHANIIVRIESMIPPGAGFKSSHALLAAILHSLHMLSHKHGNPDPIELALETVDTARRAGLTKTGALDDALAVIGDKAYITDNMEDKLLAIYNTPRKHQLLLMLPRINRQRHITTINPQVYENFKTSYQLATTYALRGEWLKAMRLNAYLTLKAHLAPGEEPLQEWIEEILALDDRIIAGVTGKGPGVFLLYPRGLKPILPRGYEVFYVYEY